MPPSVDFNPVPQVRRLVAAFRLVYEMTRILALDREGGTSFESEARLRLHLGSKPRIAAIAGTTGYPRAFRRAVDWQQKCRLR